MRCVTPLPATAAQNVSSGQALRHSVPTLLRVFGSLIMASPTASMWLLPLLILLGYSQSARASRIDTHHHILPPEYTAYCRDEGTSLGRQASYSKEPSTSLCMTQVMMQCCRPQSNLRHTTSGLDSRTVPCLHGQVWYFWGHSLGQQPRHCLWRPFKGPQHG